MSPAKKIRKPASANQGPKAICCFIVFFLKTRSTIEYRPPIINESKIKNRASGIPKIQPIKAAIKGSPFPIAFP